MADSRFVKGQFVNGFGFGMINRLTGENIEEDVQVFITKDDGAAQASTYTPVYKGNGQWTVDISSVEMNAKIVVLTTYHPDGISANFTIPTNDPADTPEVSVAPDIAALINTPKRMQTVEGEVEERSIHEIIKGDQYLKSIEAVEAVPWGMRVARTKPGSSIGGGDP